MTTLKFWLPPFLGIIVTPVCYAAGVLFSGGGHSYIAIELFFPYATGLDLTSTIPTGMFVLLVGLQFPAYGLLISFACRKNLLIVGVVVLSVIHFGAVILCLSVAPTNTYEYYLRNAAIKPVN
jgi:hypothetical protein